MSYERLAMAGQILAALAGAGGMAAAVYSAITMFRGGPQTLVEYRDEPSELADLLPWVDFVGPGVILNKNGSFQSTIYYRGPDLDSATKEELVAMSARVNNVLKRFGGGWYWYVDCHRVPATGYREDRFPDPITGLIDAERRHAAAQGTRYEGHYYLTVGWLPPSLKKASLDRWFFQREDDDKGVAGLAGEALAQFRIELARTVEALAYAFPEARILSDAQTRAYLHATVSTKRQPVSAGAPSQTLDRLLTDVALTNGRPPRLGSHWVGVLSIKQFPSAASSVPGLLDELNRLGLEYRWVSRWIALDKADAKREIDKVRKSWFAGRKGFMTLMKEMAMGSESQLENTDNVTKAMDADMAAQELDGDHVSEGYFTQTIIVYDADPGALEQKLQFIEKQIEAHGFIVANESRDGNGMDAWLGAVPGNCLHNVRRHFISSLNFIHMMPASAVWAGPARVSSDLFPPNSPPLMHTATDGSTPFRLSLYVGDVGHTFIAGPTGAGKSVLLNILRAQFRRYPKARVTSFDMGGSCRVLTHAVGGRFYDLGKEGGIAFQPLREIHAVTERAWAQEWLLDLLVAENLPITPDRKAAVWRALTDLAEAEPQHRTLTGFSALVQDVDVKQAMDPYLMDGPFGRLLDADNDGLSLGGWDAFEMQELMTTPRVVPAVLSYLFHRLELQWQATAPSMLVLDEAWLFIDHPQFVAKLREWLKVLRKKNVAVIFATQSLADLKEGSPILAAVLEACHTKIFLPNPTATSEEGRHTYRVFGLNATQVGVVASSQPKRDYYLTSRRGNRLFSLELGQLALAYCAATDAATQKLADSLWSAAGGNVYTFNLQYLEARSTDLDVGFAIDYLKSRRAAA